VVKYSFGNWVRALITAIQMGCVVGFVISVGFVVHILDLGAGIYMNVSASRNNSIFSEGRIFSSRGLTGILLYNNHRYCRILDLTKLPKMNNILHEK